jgi:hypothetical protein
VLVWVYLVACPEQCNSSMEHASWSGRGAHLSNVFLEAVTLVGVHSFKALMPPVVHASSFIKLESKLQL